MMKAIKDFFCSEVNLPEPARQTPIGDIWYEFQDGWALPWRCRGVLYATLKLEQLVTLVGSLFDKRRKIKNES